jgi:secreted PhoX family phosphatase
MKKNYIFVAFMGVVIISNAQNSPFTPLDDVDTANSVRVRISPSLNMNIVYREGSNFVKVDRTDGVVATAPAPREHDFMAYIPDPMSPNTKGTLVINHERSTIRSERPQLGFGGAISVVPVVKVGNEWKIDQSRTAVPGTDTCFAVDFSTVGWTTTNCGGALLPDGKVLTGEEIFANFRSNFMIRNNFDTAATTNGYNGDGTYTIPSNVPEFAGKKIKVHENFGWLTMIDPSTKKAVRKLYHAGRMSFEGTIAMPDGRTLIHGMDYVPASASSSNRAPEGLHGAYIWKYVADVPGDYTTGNLYVFKQNPNSYTGTWIQIPRELDSLIKAPHIAARLGATVYQRLEWTCVDPTTSKVYIAETGRDNQDMTGPVNKGSTIPKHWIDYNLYDSTTKVCNHPYGTVLVLEGYDTETPTVRPYLMGGPEKPNDLAGSKFVFNSVDGINFVRYGNKRFLLLQEDNIATSLGRIVPNFNGNFPYDIPKAFLLDLDIENPTPANLLFLMTGTRDAELTGGVFTPDGTTLFINNQHPDGTGGSLANDMQTSPKGNVYPFQRAATIAITGFDASRITNIPKIDNNAKDFVLYPNPTFNAIHFNKQVNITLYDAKGNIVDRAYNVAHLNLYGLQEGVYFLKLDDGTTHKISLVK